MRVGSGEAARDAAEDLDRGPAETKRARRAVAALGKKLATAEAES